MSIIHIRLKEDIMLKVPAAIAAARNLAQLGQERQNAQYFKIWLTTTIDTPPAADDLGQRSAERLVLREKLIMQICKALGKILQLLQPRKQPRKPAAAQVLEDVADIANCMQQSLVLILKIWLQPDESDIGAANSLQVELQVAESGLPAAVQQVASHLIPKFQAAAQQQQQQQQQQQRSKPSRSSRSSSSARKTSSSSINTNSSSNSLAAVLQDITASMASFQCLVAFSNLCVGWPGDTPLTAPALRPCFQPVVELAWAVLQAAAAAGWFADSNSLSSQIWERAFAGALRLAKELSQMLGRAKTADRKLGLWQPHAQQFASDALAKLLLVMTGVSVGVFYEQQQQQLLQQPLVQPYHQQLLEALGVPFVSSVACKAQETRLYATPVACTGGLGLVDMRLMAAAAAASSSNGSSGSSEGCSLGREDEGRVCSTTSSKSAAAAAAPAVEGISSRVYELLLLTVLEYAVLTVAVQDYSSLTTAMFLCKDLSAHVRRVQLGARCAVAGTTAGRRLAAADLTDLLLRPLLLELGPAVIHAAGVVAAAAAEAPQAVPAAVISAAGVKCLYTDEALLWCLSVLTGDVICGVESADVLDPVIVEHPTETVLLLEAAVRSAVVCYASATPQQMPGAYVKLVGMAARTAQRISAGEGRQIDEAAGQLFAFAVTVLKASQTLCCSSSAARDRSLGGSDNRRCVSRTLATMFTAASLDSIPAKMRLLLLPRLVAVVSQIVCGVISSTAWADQEALEGTDNSLLKNLCTAVHDVGVLLGEVQLPGEAAAAAEAAQQLQQQAAGLHECLLAQQQLLKQASAPADTVAGSADSAAGEARQEEAVAVKSWTPTLRQQLQQAFPGDLPQQLQQFGGAVCHQLPVRLWCCNPRCTNLQQQSELELVGGRSCACSGCRTARFCSRQCLEQCWKKQLHKSVCKRIAAGRQQQQQQQRQGVQQQQEGAASAVKSP